MKTAVIYRSGTGNTQAMAEHIIAALKAAGTAADIFSVGEISPSAAAEYDVLLLGCPAMGAEELEPDEFEPFYAELEGLIRGKTAGLFGSYDWGDGEWLRAWRERAEAAGLDVKDTLAVNMNDDPAAPCAAFAGQFAGSRGD